MTQETEPKLCQECVFFAPFFGEITATHEFYDGKQNISLCDRCYDEAITLAFWRYLTKGESPPGTRLKKFKPLSKRRAFQILWLVQEYVGEISDRFELCDGCLKLYNSEAHATLYTKSGSYCDDCRDEHGDRCSRCEEGFDWPDLVEDGSGEWMCGECVEGGENG